MSAATIEVPARFRDEFQEEIVFTVENAARELPMLRSLPKEAETARLEEENLLQGTLLAEQGRQASQGEPVTYSGNPRVLAEVARDLFCRIADEVSWFSEARPVDFGKVPRLLDLMAWLVPEAERLSVLDPEVEVAVESDVVA